MDITGEPGTQTAIGRGARQKRFELVIASSIVVHRADPSGTLGIGGSSTTEYISHHFHLLYLALLCCSSSIICDLIGH